jgi:hypothetical protein
MTKQYKDPYLYLYDSVVQRGKTGYHGVYLTNVTVVVDPAEELDYNVNEPVLSMVATPRYLDEVEWLRLLVALRSQPNTVSQSISYSSGSFQFIQEGMQIALNVFVPEISVTVFKYEVLRAIGLLNVVSEFTGKRASSVRFNIGLAEISWADLVDSGEVEEIEIPM